MRATRYTNQPILWPTKKGTIYISYAFLSPRSTQQHNLNIYSSFYIIMHSQLSDQLRLPTQIYKSHPAMPPLAEHLNITMPPVNALNEKITFFIEGPHPKLLLGEAHTTNIDSQRQLAFMIHRALWIQHHRTPLLKKLSMRSLKDASYMNQPILWPYSTSANQHQQKKEQYTSHTLSYHLETPNNIT